MNSFTVLLYRTQTCVNVTLAVERDAKPKTLQIQAFVTVIVVSSNCLSLQNVGCSY